MNLVWPPFSGELIDAALGGYHTCNVDQRKSCQTGWPPMSFRSITAIPFGTIGF